MDRPLTRWNSRTPIFRLALSLSALWVVGSLAYGLLSGSLQAQIRNRYLSKIEAQCSSFQYKLTPVNGDPFAVANASPTAIGPSIACQAASITVDSAWEKFWSGDPLRIIFLYVFAVPTLMIFGGGSWQ